MAIARSTACCGINELDGVSYGSPKESLLAANPSVPFMFFSVTSSNKKKAEALVSTIKKDKLSTVRKTRQRRNPNSGNDLIMYMWTINRDKLSAWRNKNRS